MPEQDNTLPFSRRRARDCTVGVSKTLANNSLVAAIVKSCAKHGQGRRRTKPSQGELGRIALRRIARAWDLKYKSRVPELSRFLGIVIRMYAEAGELFGPLRELSLFNQVTIDPEVHTLVWSNGADFDPETLHDWPRYAQALAERARRWESQNA